MFFLCLFLIKQRAADAIASKVLTNYIDRDSLKPHNWVLLSEFVRVMSNSDGVKQFQDTLPAARHSQLYSEECEG